MQFSSSLLPFFFNVMSGSNCAVLPRAVSTVSSLTMGKAVANRHSMKIVPSRKCSCCGKLGHNVQTCKLPGASIIRELIVKSRCTVKRDKPASNLPIAAPHSAARNYSLPVQNLAFCNCLLAMPAMSWTKKHLASRHWVAPCRPMTAASTCM